MRWRPSTAFCRSYRYPVIIGTAAIAVLGLPLLYFLTFDFDPIHLRSPKTESISTLLDLGGDPQIGINSINVVMPSLDQAASAAEKLRKLPQVLSAMTLSSFIPEDQDKKLGVDPGFCGANWVDFAEAGLD